MRLRTALGAVLVCGACAGCGQQVDSLQPAAQPSASSGQAPDPTPTAVTTMMPWTPLNIDWDNPPGTVTVPDGTDPGTSGDLPFDPITPHIGTNAWRAVTSDPADTPRADRAATWIFHMPQGPDFPGDGHLIIRESAAEPLTPALIQQIADENAASGQYSAITVASYPALLITGNNVGRVVLLDGDVRVDITGPTVTPQAVRGLAARFIQGAS